MEVGFAAGHTNLGQKIAPNLHVVERGCERVGCDITIGIWGPNKQHFGSVCAYLSRKPGKGGEVVINA